MDRARFLTVPELALSDERLGASRWRTDEVLYWRMASMKRLLAMFVLTTSFANAADYKLAKVLDVRDASSLAEAAVANHPVAAQAGGGVTASIPSQYLRCEMTVALDGTQYTVVFREDQHFKITDFNPGDPVQVRIEGKKLVLKRLDGKEMKSKILKQGPVESAGPQ
jgi:hypothetical protein